MKGIPKFCPKCNRTFPPNYNASSCPHDSGGLQELGSILNSIIAGKYVLLEEVGSGGWGTVYLAKHRELGTRVAVKILSNELCQKMTHIDRFRQESQTLARLEHPGVVRVIDAGLSPRPFIVMEYVQGRLLSELIAESGRLPVPLVCLIARRLSETLNYAHGLGVIHRDLKPQNIMIGGIDPAELDQVDRLDIKLLDFGVAKLLDQQGVAEGTGESFGSPQYMSPEQFSGEHQVGPKSDIYSASCVLFECLSGRNPFSAHSYAEWSSLHRHAAAGFKEGKDNFGKLGGELAKLILLGLSKDPDERPGTEEFIIALKKITREQESQKKHSLWAHARSKPKLFAMILAGFIILGIASSFAISMFDKSKSAQRLLELENSSKADLIETMDSARIAQKVQISYPQLKLAGIPAIDSQIYRPQSARNIVIVLSAVKRKSMMLEKLFKSWAEQGFMVLVFQLNPKENSQAEYATIISTALKEFSKDETFTVGAACDAALVSVELNLDQTLAAAREFSENKDDSLPDLAGVIEINPSVKSNWSSSPKDFHAGKFPVFYVLDASLESKSRPAVAKRCQISFDFGNCRQIFFNSNRVSLQSKPASLDEKVLEALMIGFLQANLNHDKAKESYLYSQNSVMAVNKVADLRFR